DRSTPLPSVSSSVVVNRTSLLSVAVSTVSSLQNAVVPAVLIGFGNIATPSDLAMGWVFGGSSVLIALFVGFLIAAGGALFSYVQWRRLTYTVGDQDIRVESGVLSRSARSVPYERIQDVSLEQKFIPRLLGLVAVKFETGAGGADDLSLTYLAEAEGERLRELVRDRREGVESGVDKGADQADVVGAAPRPARSDEGEALFTMGPRRLFTFGLFEFSLAVFAVLAGLLQYFDSIFDFEIWDVSFWRELADEQGGWWLELGAYAKALGVALGIVFVFVVGSATGMVRTFNREWGFRLERTARGFRRRRGLFTLTDVVMPVHRVQGVTIGTRFVRYRFGWHSLRFVSLAQDAGSSSHVVAPFAKLGEIDPIVEAAGFHLPSENARWHRATVAYRNVSIALDLALFALAAVIAAGATALFAPEWTLLATAIPLALGVLDAGVGFLSWRFKRHALEDSQIAAMAGILAPTTKIATRVKLHSVEIAQGPFARRFGYATLHLGMAGGEMAIPGVPLDRAREVRAQVLDTIAATDFSELEGHSSPAIA
ncbi:MAG: PH domain-containing protein, partial [Pseudomonadota bacterium]